MNAVTQLLNQASAGDSSAVDQLLPMIYGELKEIAHRHLVKERDSHTLNTTALVHEAYIKLADQRDTTWQNRLHFLGVASLAMRRVLVNYANARKAQKRGGNAVHLPLEQIEELLGESEAEEIISLDEALNRLAEFNPRGAEVVTHRFFGGLTHEETSEVLGVSVATIRRSWVGAQSWLRRELRDTLGRTPTFNLQSPDSAPT